MSINDLALQLIEESVGEDRFTRLLDGIFSRYNDDSILNRIVSEYYDRLKEMPNLDDLEEYIFEHNDVIAYRMTDDDLTDICPTCEKRFKCWEGKLPFDPNGWFWPQTEEYEDCFQDQLECNEDYLSFNYEAYNTRSTLMATIMRLGYAVKIQHDQLGELFDDPPLVFFKEKQLILNDAQIILLPEMFNVWKPKAVLCECPLLLT